MHARQEIPAVHAAVVEKERYENFVNVSSDILCSFNNRDSRSGRGACTGTRKSRAATNRKYAAANCKYTAPKCEHASPHR